MKKILLLLFVLALNTYTNSDVAFAYYYDDNYYNNSYNNGYNNCDDYNYDRYNRPYNDNYNYNYNRYNDGYNNYYSENSSDNGCEAGKIGPYNYPTMRNGNSYNTTYGNTSVTLVCEDGYVTIKNSSLHTNSYAINKNDSCEAGRIGSYSFPYLSNGNTYTTTVGNTTVTLICNNGYVSINNSSTTYYNYSTSTGNNYCRASSIGSYSYPDLDNYEVYSHRKTITGGELITKLECNNGYVSVIDSYTNCLYNYYSSGNSCVRSYRNRYR